MAINFSDLSKGLVVELESQPWEVLDYERNKMQKRAPVTKIKMKNMITGSVVEKSFQRDDTGMELAEIENKQAQYLYTDGEFYNFLDQESFEQYELTESQLSNAINYIKEGMVIEVIFYKGSAIDVILPTHVELSVADTPPAFKGDTAQGGNKPATLETGLKITVPMFITPGTIVKVDTRTGEYSERVS